MCSPEPAERWSWLDVDRLRLVRDNVDDIRLSRERPRQAQRARAGVHPAGVSSTSCNDRHFVHFGGLAGGWVRTATRNEKSTSDALFGDQARRVKRTLGVKSQAQSSPET